MWTEGKQVAIRRCGVGVEGGGGGGESNMTHSLRRLDLEKEIRLVETGDVQESSSSAIHTKTNFFLYVISRDSILKNR